jgi:pentatricopeptide repeat protein
MRSYDAPPEPPSSLGKESSRSKKSKRAAASAGGGFLPENPTSVRRAEPETGTSAWKSEKYVGPKDEKKKMKPGVVPFTTVVSAYCAVGDMQNARRVVEEMRALPKSWRAAPNDRTFAHLVWGYGRLGDVAGATAAAKLMAESGISLHVGSEARNSLVRACRECGLPAAHVDRVVENLGEIAAPARRRNGDRWVGRKKRNEPETTETTEKTVAPVAAFFPTAVRRAREPTDTKSFFSKDATGSASSTKKASPRSASVDRKGNGADRSGDTGWACSAAGGYPAKVRTVRVVANDSSRVAARAPGLAARRAHSLKGVGRVVRGAIAARGALFA